MIDYQAIRFWIDIAILGWGFSVSGFVIWDRRNKVTQEAIAKFRGDVSAQVDSLRSDLDLRRRRVDEHIESMKTRLSETPTRVDLSRLYEAIGDVSEIANQLSGTVQSLQNTIHMINQHLLDKGNYHG
jgi:multidrug efflux pump subunit AcrA (membrane-fusion protein)